MAYRYKMEPIAPNLYVDRGKDPGQEVANYLESTVRGFTQSGWEFFRMDEFVTYVPPGCIAGLFGFSGKTLTHYVATFRKSDQQADS